MRPRVKGALLLCLAFVLGVGVGAAGFASYAMRYWPWRPGSERWTWVLQRLDRELALRPEQHQKVELVLQETRDEFRRLREEFRPRYREIMNRSRDRIKAELDPEQRAKFDTLVADWERQAEQWRARRWGQESPAIKKAELGPGERKEDTQKRDTEGERK